MPTQRKRSGRLTSVIVKAGIVLLAIATFLGLRLQLGLTFSVALASSLTTLSLLMIFDSLVRRDSAGEAAGPDVDRLENEISKLMGAARTRQDDRGAEAPAPAAGRGLPRAANDSRRSAGAPPIPAAAGATGGPIPTARVPLPRPGGDPRAAAAPAGGRVAGPLAPPPPLPPQQRAPQPAGPNPLRPASPAAAKQAAAQKPAAPTAIRPGAEPAKAAQGSEWPDTVMPSGSPSDFWSYRPNAQPEFTGAAAGAPTLSVREPIAPPRPAPAAPNAPQSRPAAAPAAGGPAAQQRQAAPNAATGQRQAAPNIVAGQRQAASRRPNAAGEGAKTGSVSAPTGGPRPSELEIVQGLIKKLADEVNAAEASASGKLGNSPAKADGAIDQSVGALRTASATMRRKVQPALGGVFGIPGFGAKKKPQPAQSQAQAHTQASAPPLPGLAPTSGPRTPTGPQPPPLVGSAEARLVAIASAITAGRIDVLLEPIRGLGDQVTQHYEVSIRLRGESGQVLDQPADANLDGTGLLPALDTARLVRVAEVARRLEQKVKPGSVFSMFNRESLSSDEFLNGFADVYRDRTSFSSQLVLTFTQRDVRNFTQLDWNTVADMSDFGFRFALSEVTDLDMDFEDLTNKGFVYVKLDSEIFLEGLPAASSLVPAHDLCQYLAGIGLTLIVGRIDDEAKLARIFGFGVIFGQGQLFGGARPVKADVVTRQRTAAA